MTLPKPQNVTVTRTPSGILIEWNAVPDAQSYDVERDGSSVGFDITTTNFTDLVPAPDGATYVVIADFPHSNSDPVMLAPLPKAKKWSRSVPGSTTIVNWLLARPGILHAGDAIGLLTGGGERAVANPSWVNQQATRLRAVFPEVTIFAQVSGTKDVDTVARQCKANIDAVALVQETGFGVESEPWNPSQASTEARITKAKGYADAQGVPLILHMSGKGVPWRKDDVPDWNYAAFAAIVGDTFPNVIQTQRDFQSDWEGANDRATQALGLVKAQIPSWLPQVTLQSSEVNGICHNKPGDPAYAFLSELAEAEKVHGRGRGISLWSLDATALAAVLTETADWTI